MTALLIAPVEVVDTPRGLEREVPDHRRVQACRASKADEPASRSPWANRLLSPGRAWVLRARVAVCPRASGARGALAAGVGRVRPSDHVIRGDVLTSVAATIGVLGEV